MTAGGRGRVNIMMEAPERSRSFNFSSEELDSSALSSSMSIDRLFPALLECFGIILCGYIAGRANIITSTQAKGLGSFVSKFALPALLFKNMVLLDFGNVIWPFLWSILIAKVCVFFLVCILTLIVASPVSRYSKAGLFSIFATQSNDFALGYPIVEALYQSTYPEYLQYIYLVAPVSLMFLNPIGFALCEIQKWKDQGNHQQSKVVIVGVVVLQVIKNPIVFMVVIGIIAHFVLHQTVPVFMAQFVDGLANSFGGAALFYLGLSMVGQLGKLTKSTVVTLILLTTAKLLLMPLICKDMVDLLDKRNTSALNHSSLSDYAFLYGVFPTAPSVAIYAVYYNAELEVVTAGMVISTFLSAPIMYVSAWLLTIRWTDPQRLMNSLQNVSFNISIVSLVALVSHSYFLLWQSTGNNTRGSHFPVFCHEITDNEIKPVYNLVVFFQIICTTFVVAFSIFLGGGSLVCLSRGSWAQNVQTEEVNSFDSPEDPLIENEPENQTVFETDPPPRDQVYEHQTEYSCNLSGLIISLFVSLPPSGQCESRCESTDCLLVQVEELQQVADRQVARHVLMCLLLTVSLLANLSSCVWLLFNHNPGRLYLELLFFCAVVNYGQGLLSFHIQKFLYKDAFLHILVAPFLSPQSSLLYSLWYGKQEEQPQSDLSEEIGMTCTQFTKYHKQQCFHDIVKKRRCGKKTMVDCFLGCELVEWLLQVGLAQDRGEAVLYGMQLQQGGVLQHIKQEYSFQDSPLYYRFMMLRYPPVEEENMRSH
uniref:G protein-coupled receptor 155a n=1 Tax=Pundamilia nyererei TaxID=303518 RepID=A0A3B4FMV3_9CICH